MELSLSVPCIESCWSRMPHCQSCERHHQLTVMPDFRNGMKSKSGLKKPNGTRMAGTQKMRMKTRKMSCPLLATSVGNPGAKQKTL